jgi:hypothetical protein
MIGNVTTSSSPPIIPEAKIEKVLGVLGGHLYILHRGVEYAVDVAASEPGIFSYIEGEIRISRKRFAEDRGRRLEIGSVQHRGVPVLSGSYAGLAAKEAERKAKQERKVKPRPLDALAIHPLLARRADGILRIGTPPRNVVAAALSKAPTAILLPGREQRRGVQAILDVLQGKGVSLALTDAGTMYATGARVTTDVRSLIEDSRPLLVAHLRGEPMRCELRHPDERPEAVTLLVGGAAACEQHLAEGEA